MANPFYTATGNPGNHADGLSALVRGEFLLVQTAFDLVPRISTTGSFDTIFGQQGDFTFILPAVSGTLATLADVATETATRAAADTAETSARTAADAAEITARNAAIGVETTARTAADAAEVTARNTAIGVETAARIAAARGYLSGLGLSNDGSLPNTVLDIAAGSCTDSTNTVTITLGAFTKSIAGAWAAGSGANGMGNGLTATASTWYHVFAIINTGVAGVYFDTSVTAANAPTGTTAFRRIGSFKLDASVHILPFIQNIDRFDWSAPALEINGLVGTTAAVTVTLAGVPPGVATQALLTGTGIDSVAQSSFYLSSLAQADLAPLTGVALTLICPLNSTNSFSANAVASTSAQIRRRSNSTSQTISVLTIGWIDTRGRG